jgi:hypothetical protein
MGLAALTKPCVTGALPNGKPSRELCLTRVLPDGSLPSKNPTWQNPAWREPMPGGNPAFFENHAWRESCLTGTMLDGNPAFINNYAWWKSFRKGTMPDEGLSDGNTVWRTVLPDGNYICLADGSAWREGRFAYDPLPEILFLYPHPRNIYLFTGT